MGFFDKLKAVGKEVLEASGVTITRTSPKANLEEAKAEAAGAVYLEDFISDGSISSDSLPETKNSVDYSMDVDGGELLIVERVPKGLGHKNKLIRKLSLDDVVAFRGLYNNRKDLPNVSVIHYSSELICSSGECYKFSHILFERPTDSSSTLRDEMDVTLGLNKVLLYFAPLVTDEKTKQWYNEIYAARGTGPVFDEEGNVDLMAYVDMHNAWFKTKSKEWQNRMKAVQI